MCPNKFKKDFMNKISKLFNEQDSNNIELTMQASIEVASKKNMPIIPMDEFINMCMEELDIKAELFFSKDRKRDYIYKRYVVQYFLRNDYGITLQLIAQIFGLRDHSTIVHTLKVVDNLLYTNDELFLSYFNKIKSMATIQPQL